MSWSPFYFFSVHSMAEKFLIFDFSPVLWPATNPVNLPFYESWTTNQLPSRRAFASARANTQVFFPQVAKIQKFSNIFKRFALFFKNFQTFSNVFKRFSHPPAYLVALFAYLFYPIPTTLLDISSIFSLPQSLNLTILTHWYSASADK